MDIFLGFIVGFGAAFIWVWWISLFFREWRPSQISSLIFYSLICAPLFFIWHNGSTQWEPYGDFDFAYAFGSLLFWPVELASGIENLLKLESGTLGGWQN